MHLHLPYAYQPIYKENLITGFQDNTKIFPPLKKNSVIPGQEL